MLGVVPFVLLFEFLSANFPNYFSILLGLVLLAIVYALPQRRRRLRRSAPAAADRIGVAPRARRGQRAAGAMLEVSALRKAFGGLVAVDDLSFAVAARRDRRADRPERLGQDHGAQPDLRRAARRRRHIRFDGATIAGLGAHRIARLGVARTFQLVRVLAVA